MRLNEWAVCSFIDSPLAAKALGVSTRQGLGSLMNNCHPWTARQLRALARLGGVREGRDALASFPARRRVASDWKEVVRVVRGFGHRVGAQRGCRTRCLLPSADPAMGLHADYFQLSRRSLDNAESPWQELALSDTPSPGGMGQEPANLTNSTDCGEEILLYGDVEKVIIGVVLSIITLWTIAGNAMVIISVCIVKKLRQPSNYLVVSLAAADLSVALAVMPFVIITDLVGGEWLFGKVFCNVFIAMDVMCCTASIMTLCVISVDRYLGITRPLTYPVRQNGRSMAKMVITVWLLSASITLPPLFGWAKNVTVDRVCLISQDFGYTVYSTGVAFYIPMTVMLIMYYRIYKAAKISAEKHKFMGIPRQYEQEGVYNMEEDARAHHATKRSKAMEECAILSKLLKHDRKNISIFKREQKAARTLGIIVGAFTFCWLPFFLLSAARPFICGIECSCMPLRLERTLLWLGYTNSLINPLIYALFNRDLRTTFWNVLRCKYRNINRRLSAASMHEALKVTERHDCIL